MSRRPGSDRAAALFKTGPIEDWTAALAAYDETVRAVGAKKKIESELVQLNNWWVREVPALESMTARELSRLARFKMTRGKMRPLQKLVDSNKDAHVVSVTQSAFKLLRAGNWKACIEQLADLKGIGIATASFMAAAIRGDLCPAMADETIEGGGFAREYNLATYEQLRAALVSKANALNAEERKGAEWSAELVGRSLWTVATRAALGLATAAEDENTAVTNSRKRQKCN